MDPKTRADIIRHFGYGRGTQGGAYWLFARTQAERADLAKEGKAMPDGSYPIDSADELEKAIHAVGRGGADHDSIRKHIISQAKARGEQAKIPDEWNSDGSIDGGDAGAHAADATDAAVPTSDEADAKVGDDITAALRSVEQAIAAQGQDPDAGSGPHDATVATALEKAAQALTEAQTAQAADDEEDSTGKPESDPAKPDRKPDGSQPAGKPESAMAAADPTQPVDADGNVDDGHECMNPDCGHPASAHANADAGRNTGPCGEVGCTCPEMKVSVAANELEEPTAGEAEQGPEQDESQLTAADDAAVVVDAPLNVPPAVDPAPDVPLGKPFTIPVAVIEGQPTGDGRQIAPGALSWRTPPLPLMGLKTATHDPTGMSPNAPSVLCGLIESVERAGGDGGTEVLVCKGHYFATPEGDEFCALNGQMGRLGVSADIAVQDSQVEVGEVDEIGMPTDMTETLMEGTLMGVTITPFPAFEGCYIVLDGESDAIPEDVEKPIEAVVASVNWMSYAECEACDEGVEVIVASGQGPARPPGAWFAAPEFAVGDGRLVEIMGSHGEVKHACPLTVTGDGQVYGHIAPWDVCHTGKPGACITAPHSAAGYAHFMRGQHVITAEGDRVRVGVLTADTGHAPIRMTPAAAMAHYDNTALACADVACGEDEFGIWVAGAVRPDATETQIRNLRACSISGDWRDIGGQLELVAALAVNMPGFPLVQVDHRNGQRGAMVATGASIMDAAKRHAQPDLDRAVLTWARDGAAARFSRVRRAHAHSRVSALR